jgi:hypothetical protein
LRAAVVPAPSYSADLGQGRVVSRAYPGPIGRLRPGGGLRGLKREESGNSGGRATPLRSGTPSSLAHRLRAAAAVDLTGNGDGLTDDHNSITPLEPKVEGMEVWDNDGGSDGPEGEEEVDSDFFAPAWMAMLSSLGVAMPSAEEWADELASRYDDDASRSVIRLPRSVLADRAPAWQFNAHFLLSPPVVLRERIPGPLFVLVQSSFVLSGSSRPYARLRLKDPFGTLDATVHSSCLRLWGPALLRPHTALQLRDVVIFHAAPSVPSSASVDGGGGVDVHPRPSVSDGSRMLILGPGSVVGLWDAREHEEREKQAQREAATAAAAFAEEDDNEEHNPMQQSQQQLPPQQFMEHP